MTIYSLSEGKQLLSSSQVAAVSCKTENTCVPPPPGSNFCIPDDVQVDIGDEGNLMYCANGTWSPFCSLNGTTAAVACRQLGYTSFSCEISHKTFIYYSIMNILLQGLVLLMMEDTILPLMSVCFKILLVLEQSHSSQNVYQMMTVFQHVTYLMGYNVMVSIK